MPDATPARRETLVMQLASRVLELNGHGTLPQFIARRRLPGDDWRTWPELSYDLTQALGGDGVVLTSEVIRTWARRYDIPDTKRNDTDALVRIYRKQLTRVGISLGEKAAA